MVHNILSSFCDLQTIMGKNFINPLDWYRLMGVKISSAEKTSMYSFPWDLSLLQEACPFDSEKTIAESHILFWGHGDLTISSFLENNPSLNKRGLVPLEYYDGNSTFQASLEAAWYLMPLKAQCIADSVPMALVDHSYILPKGYEISLAVEELARQVFFFGAYNLYPAAGILYNCSERKFVFNEAYKTDRKQPKFIMGDVPFLGGRQFFMRCADLWSSDSTSSVSIWSEAMGVAILPFPKEPRHTFPLALSLKRKI